MIKKITLNNRNSEKNKAYYDSTLSNNSGKHLHSFSSCHPKKILMPFESLAKFFPTQFVLIWDKNDKKILPTTQESYTPISFKGNIVLDKLSKIDNLHCPCCGVSLMADDDFKKLTKSKPTSGNELAQLLRNNKKHVPVALRGIINHLEDIAQHYPDIEIWRTLYYLNLNVLRENPKKIKQLDDYIINYANKNNFTDEEKQSIEQISNILKRFNNKEFSYIEVKKLINPLLKNINYTDKPILAQKINNVLNEVNSLTYVVHLKNATNYSEQEQLEFFLIKLFKNSTKAIKNVDLSSANLEPIPYVLCTTCDKTNALITNFYYGTSKTEKALANYLKDIFDSPKFDKTLQDYIIKARFAAKYISSSKINTLTFKSEKFEDIKALIFQVESPSSMFAISTIEDVPCAGCGHPTIIFDKKTILNEEIKKAKNLQELQSIANRYSYHLKKEYRVIFEQFNNILKENPNITEFEMISKIRETSHKNIQDTIEKSLEHVNNEIQNGNLSYHDLTLYKQYANDVLPLLKYEKFFPVKTFFDLLETTMQKLDNKKLVAYFFKIKKSIGFESKRQYVIYTPNLNSSINRKSELKDMISYVFTRALTTTDHITARSKDGDDDSNNYMILCKDCNKIKRDRDLGSWVRKNKEIDVRLHLQNYLNFCVKNIKKLGMKKYFNYPMKFIEKVAKDTDYEVNLKMPDEHADK